MTEQDRLVHQLEESRVRMKAVLADADEIEKLKKEWKKAASA